MKQPAISRKLELLIFLYIFFIFSFQVRESNEEPIKSESQD